MAMPKFEDAKHISEILKRHGIKTAFICTTGENVLSAIRKLDRGIVICGSRFSDMHYTKLAKQLPEYFKLLLLASPVTIEKCPAGIMTLAFPIRGSDLVNTVDNMIRQLDKQKMSPKNRTEQEQNYINNAKKVLMERKNMTEQEAFRYIQKCSMDSGTNMVESAQMVLLMEYDGWQQNLKLEKSKEK